MKKTIFLAIIFAFCVHFSFAQDKSKKEKEKEKRELKKWKETKKDALDEPLKFKDMVEGVPELTGENAGRKRQLENIKETLDAATKRNESLQKELDELLQNPDKAKQDAAANEDTQNGGGGDNYQKGRIFKVQISYTADGNPSTQGNTKSFGVENDGDGKYKYTVGYFRDYKEATHFRYYLNKLGIKGAWVVPYKDNERVNVIAEVLTPQEIEWKKQEAEQGRN